MNILTALFQCIRFKFLLMMLFCFYGAPLFADNLLEKPSADYVQLIRQWSEVTHFAKNASDVVVGKITQDLQKDPKYQKMNTPAMTTDLQQFFYELFNSQEIMVELAALYSQYFTLDEMMELVKFYNTPLGQKAVQANASLVLKSEQLASELLRKHEKGYMKIVAKYIEKEHK